MRLIGRIELVKRIRYRNNECEGITKAYKQFFHIRIVRGTLMRDLFPEVLLHELIHLWFFICFGVYGLYLSERRQHKLMNQILPRMSRRFLILLKTKGRKRK